MEKVYCLLVISLVLLSCGKNPHTKIVEKIEPARTQIIISLQPYDDFPRKRTFVRLVRRLTSKQWGCGLLAIITN